MDNQFKKRKGLFWPTLSAASVHCVTPSLCASGSTVYPSGSTWRKLLRRQREGRVRGVPVPVWRVATKDLTYFRGLLNNSKSNVNLYFKKVVKESKPEKI